MALRILDAGTLRTIKRLRIMQAGVLRDIKTIKVINGGTLRTVATFADPLTVSASPFSVTGRAAGTGTQTITTDSATATVAGGRAPFAYAWTLISNGGGTASSALSPSFATSAFSKPNVPVDVIYADTWRVTVTDALGSTASDEITATFINAGIS